MPTDTPELLPCPFCGEPPIREVDTVGSEFFRHTEVGSCFLRAAPIWPRSGHVEQWNRRAGLALMQEEHRAVNVRLGLMQGELYQLQTELAEWNALGTAVIYGGIPARGEPQLWPNPWRQTIAMVAWAYHDTREKLESKAAELTAANALLDSGMIVIDGAIHEHVALRESIAAAHEARAEACKAVKP